MARRPGAPAKVGGRPGGSLKFRELLQTLRGQGGKALRTRGSHQTWQMPSGATFPVVVNHLNDDVPPPVLASIRRALGAKK